MPAKAGIQDICTLLLDSSGEGLIRGRLPSFRDSRPPDRKVRLQTADKNNARNYAGRDTMADKLFDDADGSERALRFLPEPDTIPYYLAPCRRAAVTRLFRQLVARFRRHFPVDKASLAFHDRSSGRLRATHIYAQRTLRTSLALTIPADNSVLYQILMQGFPVADNYPESLTGSIIEKKLLLSANTKSVLVVPLVHDGERLGVVSFASATESAFSIYLEGVGQNLVSDFISQLKNASPTD